MGKGVNKNTNNAKLETHTGRGLGKGPGRGLWEIQDITNSTWYIDCFNELTKMTKIIAVPASNGILDAPPHQTGLLPGWLAERFAVDSEK